MYDIVRDVLLVIMRARAQMENIEIFSLDMTTVCDVINNRYLGVQTHNTSEQVTRPIARNSKIHILSCEI